MLTKKALSEIRALTQANLHGEAYELASKELGLTELAENFAAINRRHRAAGELLIEDYNARSQLYQELIQNARTALPREQYNALYMAT